MFLKFFPKYIHYIPHYGVINESIYENLYKSVENFRLPPFDQ